MLYLIRFDLPSSDPLEQQSGFALLVNTGDAALVFLLSAPGTSSVQTETPDHDSFQNHSLNEE